MFDSHSGEELTDDELTERYREFIDEIEAPITVAGIEFSASRILEELDPIAFSCGQNDWESFMLDDGELTENAPETDDDDDETEGN